VLKKSESLYIGAASLMIALLTWIVLKAVRTSMIISIGIIATNYISTGLVWLFGLIGITMTGIGLYQLIKGSSQDRLKKSSLAYRSKTSGQEEIRDQLKIIIATRPKLRQEINDCLNQLDSVKSMYDRFNQLIKSNEAEFVSGAIVGLKEIERTVCSNLKWVINSSIAAEEDYSSATDKFYDQSRERIRQVIDANDLIIDKGNEFLLALADNISQMDASSATTLLDSWLEVIREQNEQSTIMGGRKN